MNTKERIIYEALQLFSVKGYDAVSTRAIAKAVGVTDSAMYKHFSSKQELLDGILKECQDRFFAHLKETDFMNLDWSDLQGICMSFYDFQTGDQWISGFRKILMMEQFKNDHARELYRKFFIEMPVKGQVEVFKTLIAAGVLRDEDPELMSMELYAPFFLYHTWDSEENREKLKAHVNQFIKNYGRREEER